MLKYTFRFIESNRRLEERRTRTKTLELPREMFDHYDVDKMIKEFRAWADRHVCKDSTLTVKTIKVGRTEFQI